MGPTFILSSHDSDWLEFGESLPSRPLLLRGRPRRLRDGHPAETDHRDIKKCLCPSLSLQIHTKLDMFPSSATYCSSPWTTPESQNSRRWRHWVSLTLFLNHHKQTRSFSRWLWIWQIKPDLILSDPIRGRFWSLEDMEQKINILSIYINCIYIYNKLNIISLDQPTFLIPKLHTKYKATQIGEISDHDKVLNTSEAAELCLSFLLQINNQPGSKQNKPVDPVPPCCACPTTQCWLRQRFTFTLK